MYAYRADVFGRVCVSRMKNKKESRRGRNGGRLPHSRCVSMRNWRQRSSFIVASDIFTSAGSVETRRTSSVHASVARTHAAYARDELSRRSLSHARSKFDSRSLTEVDGPPPPSSSSSSSSPLSLLGRGWRGRRVARSETRLGETTPRLINPPSVADEGSERRQRRQRDNAHSTTGRTHRARTHLAAGTCDPHALFTGKPEALEKRARAR